MDAIEARERVERIKSQLGEFDHKTIEDRAALLRDEGWLAIGYSTWRELCDVEFGGIRLALPPAERRPIVADLRAEGMSTRAIGAALGVDQKTVVNDLRSEELSSVEQPERVTSLDGRGRPAAMPRREPVAPQRDPLAEQAQALADALRAPNVEREAAEYRRNVASAIDKVFALVQFDPERTADVIEDEHARLIESAAERINQWADLVRNRRRGLRVVEGERL